MTERQKEAEDSELFLRTAQRMKDEGGKLDVALLWLALSIVSIYRVCPMQTMPHY